MAKLEISKVISKNIFLYKNVRLQKLRIIIKKYWPITLVEPQLQLYAVIEHKQMQTTYLKESVEYNKYFFIDKKLYYK